MNDKNYEDFLDITGGSRAFVEDINDLLRKNNCKRNIQLSKSGFTVSYLLQSTKRTLATFICRKSGIKLRFYPSHLSEYEGFLDTLPVKMKNEIIRSSVCKRLINPEQCNPKCTMGYDFMMDREHYQKCRHMAFMPTVTEENNAYIKAFLENEMSYH